MQKIWVGDITYIPTHMDFSIYQYIFFSNKLIGRSMDTYLRGVNILTFYQSIIYELPLNNYPY